MKKFLVAAVIAMMVLVPVAVFADEGSPDGEGGRGPRRRKGHIVQITSLSLSEISFEGKDGEIISLAITSETEFLSVGEDGPGEASYSDFSVGDYVALKVAKGEEEGSPTLKALVQLPEDFDPENRPEKGEHQEGEGTGGEVTAISETSITVTNKEGESVTIAITEDTKINAENIEIGDKVGIKYDAETGEAICIGGGRRPGRQHGPNGSGQSGPQGHNPKVSKKE